MKHTHTEGPGSILKSRFARGVFPLVAALLACALAAPEALAEVLVYEGFHPSDYGITTGTGTKSANNGNTTGNYTTNVVTGGWNAMGGSQITVYGADFGLTLPAEMTAAGFSAQGGSIGLNPDSSGDNAQHRAMSHNLAANALKRSSGTLYFRMLLNLDSTAAKKLAAGASLSQKNGGYFGFGFGKSPSENDYYAPTHLQSAISFVIWKNSSNQYVLSFVHTTASGTTFTSYPIITGITTLGKSYICYAEVKVGAGTDGKEILRAGAMAVDAYNVETPWAELANGSDSVEVELITDSNYPTCMAVAGPYGTKDGDIMGYFRADEIIVGTEIADVLLFSQTMPKLSGGSLSLSGGTYTASATLANSEADVTYTLSDGDDTTTETPVLLGVGSFAADSTATGTFAAPADDTTYEVVLTAENVGRETAELSLGTIYGGTLALTKVSDGNELGCVPATLTVSRANPDPLPLVVNYSFTPGTAVAGVNYVDDAGSVTIPANATSATITVTPLVDLEKTTDTSLTVSVAAGNYVAPAGVAVTIACAPDPATLVCSSVLTFPYAPATALENFPVLVRISTAAPKGFMYEVCPDASHLWFTDAGGTTLPFEVDTWDVDGTSLVWVSVPSLSSSTAITMHWAGDAANVPNDMPASREVWTRAGYRAVWHFSGSAAESVANLTATANGSPTYNGNDTYPGPLGKTLWLNGSSYLSFANDQSWATLGENSTLSISCLARTTSSSPGCDRMISSMADWKDTSGYELTLQSSPAKITVGSSGIGSTGSQFVTDDSSVRLDTAWRYLTATYSTEMTKLYVNGGKKGESQLKPVVAPTGALSIGAEADGGTTRWTGGIDEVRIRAAASTAEWIAEEYATITNTAYVSCSVAATDPAAPAIAMPVVTINAGGSVTVTAEISNNDPASIYCVIGSVTNAMLTSDSELPKTYSTTFSGLATDTTYAGIVAAISTGGFAYNVNSPVFYIGDISAEKVSDANEDGLVSGSFRISRADTAHDLTVSYTIGGTAVAGQTYVALSGTATIPAGTSSVDIEVVPIRDPKKVVDTTVVLTLASGLYGISGNASSATLTIVNTPPYSSLFAYHVPITVSGYAGESTLADFPVLVTLAADSPSGFDYADCAADGSDIRFLDERDNVLSHEIETWETGGTSYIWVKVPSLAGKNTQFSLYYGTNGVSQLPEVHATNVWSRYAAVFHGGSTIADATGKSATVNASTVTGSASGGKAGGAMTKGAAIGVLFSNPVTSHALSSAAKVSVSGWFKRSNSGNTAIVASAKNGWSEAGFMALVENGTYFSIGVDGTHQGASGKGALTKDVWGHLAFSYDSTALKSYFNGISIYENASAKSLKDKGDAYWAFGSLNNQNVNCFQGAMDELRVFNGVASADWIKAECDSVDSPATFAVLDDVRPAGVPYVVNPVVTREAGVFSVSAEILEAVPASIVYDADGVTGSMTTSDGELPMVYSATLSGLAADTTYKCSVVATSTGGAVSSNACPTAFYNGELTVEKVSDAVMKGFVPGVFRISRADTAHDLAVSYTVGGTAVAGQIYEALSGSATIPAGSQFVDISVVPLLDKQTTADTTVVLTLVDGFYGISESAGSAALSIAGYKPVKPTDYNWSVTATPSDAVKTTLGANAYADFPVLVRLPAAASGKFRESDGSDLLVTDDNGDILSFEIDTFASDDSTLVWVKVPLLSADTRLTVYFGGPENFENNPTNVWTDYVGVWHMNESSGTVADATGHGLGASSAKKTAGSVAYAGGVVGNARQTAVNGTKDYLSIPSYDSQNIGGNFTFSCWYDATARLGHDRLVSRKSSYGDLNGWEVELSNSNTKLAARGASGTSISASFPDIVNTGWMRFTFVYSGSTLKAYLDGAQIGTGSIDAATDNGKPLSIGCNSNGSEAYFVGYVDEARLRKGAMSAKEVALEHATMADAAFFEYADIAAVDQTAQDFDAPTVIRNANGTYTISVVLAENNGDVGVIYNSGASAITNIVAENASPNTYTDTPANLVSGTTYAFAAYGKNANGTEVTKKGGIFYNGDLTVEKVSDAIENGLVPGVFRISRADTAHDLAITYTVGGTAVAGRAYEALSGTATIPAGTNSVDIQVVPYIDAQTTVDTTVIVTLSAGLYGIDAQAGSAELTIVNLAAPPGFNVWVAQTAGLASVASNWSEGHCPTDQENVLFDGRFSTANCEWDAVASATVASWTQTNSYTGTVQIDTTYDNTFPALNITGDVEILGGKWTHRINEAADGQKYHLKAIVGGDFTLASGCTITAEMKGYWAQKYPAGSTYSAHAASGDGFDKIYGNVYRPADLGAGSSSAGSATDNKSGGGAVWLEVGGAATLNGTINVRGRQFDGSNTACGSVYVKAKSCSGAGSILANFLAASYYNGSRGSGGRVAIELTEATTLGFPVANVKINGINAGASGGGGGTFYLKTADPAKPNGTLYLDDQRNKSYGARWHNPQAITAIPAGETWTFDAIVISGYGMLAVPAGTTLNLPNGPMSVSASSTRQGGIRYDGGTINWGSAPYEFASNWIFQANAPYTFDGDVVVHSGGAIGCMQYRGNSDFSNFTKCDVTVNGNLTVEPGGYLYANGAGPDMEIGGTISFHGGQSSGASGNTAYDSIFSPSLPGWGNANGDFATTSPGGGLLLFNVTGDFVNNGSVTANGNASYNAGASGGSISITAGTLSGSGTFKVDTASGSSGSAGGGRIAVRLTNGDFAAGAETNFFARGATVLNSNTNTVRSSSAGTVYLQGKRDAEKGGTIYVRNDKNALNTNTYTPIPAGVTKGGIAPDAAIDFKSASLVVGDRARVKLFDSFKMCALGMESGTSLDLNGQTLTVKRAKLGENRIAPGTYTAAQLEAAGLTEFIDTADGAGGTLRVLGIGTAILVR